MATTKTTTEAEVETTAEATVDTTAETEITLTDEEYHKAYMNEYVPIKLFCDGDKYKNDVFVAVNGESCLIQRGTEVMVKRKFALALDNGASQDAEAAKIAAGFETIYKNAVKALS